MNCSARCLWYVFKESGALIKCVLAGCLSPGSSPFQVMKNLKFILILAAVILGDMNFMAVGQSLVEFKDGGKNWCYEKVMVHGWTVYLEAKIAKDPVLKGKIEDRH